MFEPKLNAALLFQRNARGTRIVDLTDTACYACPRATLATTATVNQAILADVVKNVRFRQT